MRKLCPRGLPYVALGCAILAAQTSKADTILINDLPGLITVSVTDPVREQASSGAGFADVTINPLAYGATLIDGAPQDEWLFVEARQGFASDFATLNGSDTAVDFHFFSMDEMLTFYDGPTIVENGEVQVLVRLEWSDGTIDTIEFQSTEPTPEPSTLLLLCTSMLGVGATGRRKYFSRVFSNARARGVSAARRLRS